MTTLFQYTDTDGNVHNDIILDENGQLKVSRAQDAYGTIIADSIRTVKGEVPLDIDLGISYFDIVLGDNMDLALWRAEVKDVVMSYPFVQTIREFTSSIDYQEKALKYKLVIETDLGRVRKHNNRNDARSGDKKTEAQTLREECHFNSVAAL